MGLKRLAKDGNDAGGGSGYLADVSPGAERGDDSPDFHDRAAIVLHVGDFLSQDGPVKFDEKRLRNAAKVNNARIEQLASHYGGVDKIPVGEYPKVMEDHEGANPSRATIGRMMGPYEIVKTDVPKLGLKNVTAIKCGKVRFLGKENADRAKDGRIYDLSLGVNEKQNDLFDELSAVGEGAAAGARLLSQGKPNKGDPMPKLNKKTEGKKRLAALVEATTRLSALSTELGGMKTKLVATSDKIRMAARKSKIDGDVRGLMRLGKMTPAEYKNLKLEELAKLNDESLTICLSTFRAREKPVIDPTQRGSVDAVEQGELAKDLGVRRLRAQTREDMKRLGAKLSAEAEAEHKADKEAIGGKKSLEAEVKKDAGKDPSAEPGEEAHLNEYRKHMGDLKKHLAAGNLDEAKKSFELASKMGLSAKHLAFGTDAGEETDKNYSEMQEQLDSLSALTSKLAGEVDKILAVEKDEGHDELEAEPAAEKKPGEEGAA